MQIIQPLVNTKPLGVKGSLCDRIFLKPQSNFLHTQSGLVRKISAYSPLVNYSKFLLFQRHKPFGEPLIGWDNHSSNTDFPPLASEDLNSMSHDIQKPNFLEDIAVYIDNSNSEDTSKSKTKSQSTNKQKVKSFNTDKDKKNNAFEATVTNAPSLISPMLGDAIASNSTENPPLLSVSSSPSTEDAFSLLEQIPNQAQPLVSDTPPSVITPDSAPAINTPEAGNSAVNSQNHQLLQKNITSNLTPTQSTKTLPVSPAPTTSDILVTEPIPLHPVTTTETTASFLQPTPLHPVTTTETTASFLQPTPLHPVTTTETTASFLQPTPLHPLPTTETTASFLQPTPLHPLPTTETAASFLQPTPLHPLPTTEAGASFPQPTQLHPVTTTQLVPSSPSTEDAFSLLEQIPNQAQPLVSDTPPSVITPDSSPAINTPEAENSAVNSQNHQLLQKNITPNLTPTQSTETLPVSPEPTTSDTLVTELTPLHPVTTTQLVPSSPSTEDAFSLLEQSPNQAQPLVSDTPPSVITPDSTPAINTPEAENSAVNSQNHQLLQKNITPNLTPTQSTETLPVSPEPTTSDILVTEPTPLHPVTTTQLVPSSPSTEDAFSLLEQSPNQAQPLVSDTPPSVITPDSAPAINTPEAENSAVNSQNHQLLQKNITPNLTPTQSTETLPVSPEPTTSDILVTEPTPLHPVTTTQLVPSSPSTEDAFSLLEQSPNQAQPLVSDTPPRVITPDSSPAINTPEAGNSAVNSQNHQLLQKNITPNLTPTQSTETLPVSPEPTTSDILVTEPIQLHPVTTTQLVPSSPSTEDAFSLLEQIPNQAQPLVSDTPPSVITPDSTPAINTPEAENSAVNSQNHQLLQKNITPNLTPTQSTETLPVSPEPTTSDILVTEPIQLYPVTTTQLVPSSPSTEDAFSLLEQSPNQAQPLVSDTPPSVITPDSTPAINTPEAENSAVNSQNHQLLQKNITPNLTPTQSTETLPVSPEPTTSDILVTELTPLHPVTTTQLVPSSPSTEDAFSLLEQSPNQAQPLVSDTPPSVITPDSAPAINTPEAENSAVNSQNHQLLQKNITPNLTPTQSTETLPVSPEPTTSDILVTEPTQLHPVTTTQLVPSSPSTEDAFSLLEQSPNQAQPLVSDTPPSVITPDSAPAINTPEAGNSAVNSQNHQLLQKNITPNLTPTQSTETLPVSPEPTTSDILVTELTPLHPVTTTQLVPSSPSTEDAFSLLEQSPNQAQPLVSDTPPSVITPDSAPAINTPEAENSAVNSQNHQLLQKNITPNLTPTQSTETLPVSPAPTTSDILVTEPIQLHPVTTTQLVPSSPSTEDAFSLLEQSPNQAQPLVSDTPPRVITPDSAPAINTPEAENSAVNSQNHQLLQKNITPNLTPTQSTETLPVSPAPTTSDILVTEPIPLHPVTTTQLVPSSPSTEDAFSLLEQSPNQAQPLVSDTPPRVITPDSTPAINTPEAGNSAVNSQNHQLLQKNITPNLTPTQSTETLPVSPAPTTSDILVTEPIQLHPVTTTQLVPSSPSTEDAFSLLEQSPNQAQPLVSDTPPSVITPDSTPAINTPEAENSAVNSQNHQLLQKNITPNLTPTQSTETLPVSPAPTTSDILVTEPIQLHPVTTTQLVPSSPSTEDAFSLLEQSPNQAQPLVSDTPPSVITPDSTPAINTPEAENSAVNSQNHQLLQKNITPNLTPTQSTETLPVSPEPTTSDILVTEPIQLYPVTTTQLVLPSPSTEDAFSLLEQSPNQAQPLVSDTPSSVITPDSAPAINTPEAENSAVNSQNHQLLQKNITPNLTPTQSTETLPVSPAPTTSDILVTEPTPLHPLPTTETAASFPQPIPLHPVTTTQLVLPSPSTEDAFSLLEQIPNQAQPLVSDTPSSVITPDSAPAINTPEAENSSVNSQNHQLREETSSGEAKSKLHFESSSALQGFTTGGQVTTTHPGNNQQIAPSDTVPAMLTPGEFVINAKDAQKNISLLEHINSGGVAQDKILSSVETSDVKSPTKVESLQDQSLQAKESAYISSQASNSLISSSLGLEINKQRRSILSSPELNTFDHKTTDVVKPSGHYSSPSLIFRKRKITASPDTPSQWSNVEELLNVSTNEYTGFNSGGVQFEQQNIVSDIVQSPSKLNVSGKLPSQVQGFASGGEVIKSDINTNIQPITETIKRDSSLSEEEDHDDANLEVLAREIYSRLRQRLEIEGERYGVFSGRLPW